MTKAALEALMNGLLASAQPITAGGKHRPFEQHVINELYDPQSRGNVLQGVQTTVSLSSGDKVLLIRGGQAHLVDEAVFNGVVSADVDGGTP